MHTSRSTLAAREHAATLDAFEACRAEDAATIARSPRSTIEPRPHRPSAPAVLERLARERRLGVEESLVFEETLGEGGMGIVRSAVQLPLGRRVAVKGSPDAAAAALAELDRPPPELALQIAAAQAARHAAGARVAALEGLRADLDPSTGGARGFSSGSFLACSGCSA